jgi:hypothetical protein
VGYLEERDDVRRVPDPTDGRGRVVVYADRGTRTASPSNGAITPKASPR